MPMSIPRRALAFLAIAFLLLTAAVAGQVWTASPAAAQTVTVGDGDPNMNRVTNSVYSDSQVLVCDDRGGCKTVSPGRTASADLASMPQNVAMSPWSSSQHRLVHPNGYVQPWVLTNYGPDGGWIRAGDLMRYFGCYTGCLVQVIFDAASPPPAHTNCAGDIQAGCVKNDSTYYHLIVCENWSGTAGDPGCANGSATQSLPPKTWSNYFDTDGFYVPAGYDAVMDGTVDPYRDVITATGWHKVGNAQNWSVYLVKE